MALDQAAARRRPYAFIAENRLIFVVRAMCRMLSVHPTGFYAWLREPFCQRALEDQRQTVLLKQAWDESGAVSDTENCTMICVLWVRASAPTGHCV